MLKVLKEISKIKWTKPKPLFKNLFSVLSILTISISICVLFDLLLSLII